MFDRPTVLSAKKNSRRRTWVTVVALAALTLSLLPVSGSWRSVAATEVRLVAAGDFGASTATNSVLMGMAERSPDAALALGDLAYTALSPESAWCEYVKQRVGQDFAFELIAGNHESLDQQDGAINNYSACLPNQVPGIVGTYGREYYMDLPKAAPLVRVILASPGLTFEDGKWNYAQGDAHYNWVSEAIDDGRARGAKWIVVAAHIPCLSVGRYNCPSNRDFYNLMVSKGVDLVLHGHEHAYMRTHQLRTGTTECPTLTVGSVNQACIADTDGAFSSGRGTVFATVGTGGIPLRDVNGADTEAGYFAKYSGLNENPTHGLLDLTATETGMAVQFVPTSGAGMTDAFTIEAGLPPENVAPVARITTTKDQLTLTADGTSSSDSDGTIVSYAWSFGDGATAAVATPDPHTYNTPGTYTISLTVTDDDGATHTAAKTVTVTDAATALAQDSFDRTVAAGWGTAPVGGDWTTSPSTAFSVSTGEGQLSNAAGSGRKAYLRAVSSASTGLSLSLSPDKVATGSGLYIYVVGRSVVGQGEYIAKVRLRPDGRAAVSLTRMSATGRETTILSPVLVPDLTYTAGSTVRLRMEVTGSNPTTVRAKVWDDTAAEPADWLVTASDVTAGLQGPGSLGLTTYYSSSATNSPLVLAVDELAAVAP
jgi:PKD repeat protein